RVDETHLIRRRIDEELLDKPVRIVVAQRLRQWTARDRAQQWERESDTERVGQHLRCSQAVLGQGSPPLVSLAECLARDGRYTARHSHRKDVAQLRSPDETLVLAIPSEKLVCPIA